MATLVPLGHIALGDVGILRHFREPGREERGVQRAVRRIAGLLNELIRRVRPAAGNHADVQLLLFGLLQDKRQLLDRGGDEQRVAARMP